MHEAVREPCRDIRPGEPDRHAGDAVDEVVDRTAEVEQHRRFEEVDVIAVRQRNGGRRVPGLAQAERFHLPGGVAVAAAHETEAPDGHERQHGDAPPGQRKGGIEYGRGVHLTFIPIATIKSTTVRAAYEPEARRPMLPNRT